MAESASVRLPTTLQLALSSPDASTYASDMPREIPLSRWDPDDIQHLRLGSKAPARFAAFLDGTSWLVVADSSVESLLQS